MKAIPLLIALLIGINCHSQNITYDDLISIDWNDYPFSAVEMLIDKGFEYFDKQTIGESFGAGEQTRESLYELIYARPEPKSGAFVCVDEMSSDNLPPDLPVIKLVFTYESKSAFTELSDEIKSKCGEPYLEFYVSPDSVTFIIEKELRDGEPWYSILIYHMTKEEFEEIRKAVEEILKELENQ